MYILFMDADGTVDDTNGFQKISDTARGFTATLDSDGIFGDAFGISVAGIGDINNDGIEDIAVGAHLDDDGGTNRGAVYILFMDADGTVDDTKGFQKISVSRAERNCTSRAERNCTTERRGVSIKVPWSVRA